MKNTIPNVRKSFVKTLVVALIKNLKPEISLLAKISDLSDLATRKDFWCQVYANHYGVKEELGAPITEELEKLAELGTEAYLRYSQGLRRVKRPQENKS